MSHHHHKDVRSAQSLVVVVSDTRTLATDEAGPLIVEAFESSGHSVSDRIVVPDERAEIRQCVINAVADPSVDVVVLTGGTGIAPRDVTPEAVYPLLSRELPGFGEAFRRISFDEVGVNGLLSRAFAGFIERTLLFALPGSKRACKTAMDALVLPMIGHALGLRD